MPQDVKSRRIISPCFLPSCDLGLPEGRALKSITALVEPRWLPRDKKIRGSGSSWSSPSGTFH